MLGVVVMLLAFENFNLCCRVVSRAGLFGSGSDSGLKLTKISGLIRA